MGESGRGGSVDHCLALKVMRLTRPSLGQSTVVQTSSLDLGSELLDQHQARDVNTSPGLASLSPGCLLVLPQSFGNIYLGETFTSYVCVHNDSTEVCSTVILRADLQTATQRINLVPGSDNVNNSRDSLAPGSSIDQVSQSQSATRPRTALSSLSYPGYQP